MAQHFLNSESWRALRVMSEFVDSVEFMANAGPSVSIFGSARLGPGTKYYKIAEEIGSLLAQKGLSVITGGGPGIMEAANKGAVQINVKNAGKSIGLNIQLPHEQKPNECLDRSKTFHYFFIRKVMFVKYAKAIIIMPGGYGTFDEFFEIMTLLQTRKISSIPLILIDREFWSPMLDFFQKQMLKMGLIDKEDLKLFEVVDTAKEAVQKVMNFVGKTTKMVVDNINYDDSTIPDAYDK